MTAVEQTSLGDRIDDDPDGTRRGVWLSDTRDRNPRHCTAFRLHPARIRFRLAYGTILGGSHGFTVIHLS